MSSSAFTAGSRSISFRQRVVAAVRRIPPGCVATYGDIAALAGSPRAWRAVGSIMRTSGDPATPCHRVIGAGGDLGGYGGNLQMKRDLLRAEGVVVGEKRVRHFASVRWTGGTARARQKRLSRGNSVTFQAGR